MEQAINHEQDQQEGKRFVECERVVGDEIRQDRHRECGPQRGLPRDAPLHDIERQRHDTDAEDHVDATGQTL